MKNKLFTLAMILGFGIISAKLNAQTTVTIAYAGDSTNNGTYCPPPVHVSTSIYGNATGYSANTSISLYVNFGDGTDTIVQCPIQQTWYVAYTDHSYTAKGIYNVQYIATGPDGKADTLNDPNGVIVGDTCGNISGKVYIDANADCQFNVGETVLPNSNVELIYNNQHTGWAYTNVNGDYFFSVPGGSSYTIKLGSQTAYYGYVTSCPVSGQYAVSSFPSPGNNFGVTCSNNFDLRAGVSSQRFRPGFNSKIYPYLMNASCVPVSGKAKLVLDDPRITFVSAQNAPDQIIGDTLIWNFSNVANINSNWGSSFLGFVEVLTDVNAVIGDSICIKFIVTPIIGDVNQSNNTSITCMPISNSWDPNEKNVSAPGMNASGKIAPGTNLSYNIQFQNTGNDTAYNIFILDTLDANLDMSTFTPTASSHGMTVDILPGNVARFTFSNIMLVDSVANEPLSHGFVAYNISAKPGLVAGTQIKNTAGIYFDFNPPVITNTTVNTIALLLLGVNENGSPLQNITVYPNPANNYLFVTLTEDQVGAQVILMDALGQEVINEKADLREIKLNVSHLPAGIYNLILRSDKQIANGRVVVIK